jgi:hypothetical protein
MTEKSKDKQKESVETLSTQCQNLDQKLDLILDKIERRKRKKAS